MVARNSRLCGRCLLACCGRCLCHCFRGLLRCGRLLRCVPICFLLRCYLLRCLRGCEELVQILLSHVEDLYWGLLGQEVLPLIFIILAHLGLEKGTILVLESSIKVLGVEESLWSGECLTLPRQDIVSNSISRCILGQRASASPITIPFRLSRWNTCIDAPQNLVQPFSETRVELRTCRSLERCS